MPLYFSLSTTFGSTRDASRGDTRRRAPRCHSRHAGTSEIVAARRRGRRHRSAPPNPQPRHPRPAAARPRHDGNHRDDGRGVGRARSAAISPACATAYASSIRPSDSDTSARREAPSSTSAMPVRPQRSRMSSIVRTPRPARRIDIRDDRGAPTRRPLRIRRRHGENSGTAHVVCRCAIEGHARLHRPRARSRCHDDPTICETVLVLLN